MSNWERRPLPCQTGYNQCAAPEPVFTVEYDQNADMLIVTSSIDVFGPVDQVNFVGSNGSGTATPTIQSGTTLRIDNAAATLFAPTDITQLDFFSPGPTLVGIWTGTVHVESAIDPANYPLLEGIYSPNPNEVVLRGQRFLSASAGGITHMFLRLASYSLGCLEGPQVGVYLDGTPNDYGWVVSQFDDNTIRLLNNKFTDCEPDDSSGVFVATGASFDAPNYGSPVGDGYYFWEPWGETFSTPIDGSTNEPPTVAAVDVTGHEIHIQGQNFVNGEWAVDRAQIRLIDTGDTPPPIYNVFAYDPSGPNAGSTSPGVTINDWTDTDIRVTLDSTYDNKSYIGNYIWDLAHNKVVYTPQTSPSSIPLT